MSFGEGNLRERVSELEAEIAGRDETISTLIESRCEWINRCVKLESLVRDMWLTWKLLDLEGEGPNRFHNGWKTFSGRMAELGIETEARES